MHDNRLASSTQTAGNGRICSTPPATHPVGRVPGRNDNRRRQPPRASPGVLAGAAGRLLRRRRLRLPGPDGVSSRTAGAQEAGRSPKLADAPKNTPKPQGPIVIAISIENQHLKIYDANGLFAESPVSTGVAGHSTPMGVFSITQKNKYHRSNIYSNAPMPYMQRITWSGIALHAGVAPRPSRVARLYPHADELCNAPLGLDPYGGTRDHRAGRSVTRGLLKSQPYCAKANRHCRSRAQRHHRSVTTSRPPRSPTSPPSLMRLSSPPASQRKSS